MSILDSVNNPLEIASVTAPAGGVIGMAICPGKIQQQSVSGEFKRDLDLDLDLIKAWGAAAVITLMPQSELDALQVGHLGAETESRELLWFHLPIEDISVPEASFERDWLYQGLRLRQLLRAGKRILIHCRGGLGRTGMIAARLLVELGMSASQAVAEVRKARPGAIQTPAQEHYVHDANLATNDDWLDRLLGCLLGGAVGDAFGYAVEFDSLESIRQRFGPKGMTQPQYQQGKLVVSDDTQMTLFTLEGLLRCTDGEGAVNQEEALEQIRLAYLDWLDTQSGRAAAPHLSGQLARSPALRTQRAPGNTCLAALSQGGKGTLRQAINNSKGCGGVMRTAPVGFLSLNDPFDLAAGAAALTHGHPDGWAPAGVLARIVRRLIRGERKFLAVRNGFSDASEWGHVYGVVPSTDLYRLAKELGSRMRFNPEQAIRRLGHGWVGDEALAIALYAFLSARNFQGLIIRAANHDGDSDSTASIAGQLWGAARGIADIPHAWVRRLDVLDDILALAAQAKDWPVEVDSQKENWFASGRLPPPLAGVGEGGEDDSSPEDDEGWSDGEDCEVIDENAEWEDIAVEGCDRLNEKYEPTGEEKWGDTLEIVIEQAKPDIVNQSPGLKEQFDAACIPAEASATEYPPPAFFDFSDAVQRAHGLVAFYHHGNSHRLQATQLIWEQLPAPRADNSTRLCQHMGIKGHGKKGLLRLMSRFLKEADEACAAVVSDGTSLMPEGTIDWAATADEFQQMDKALLSFAWAFSRAVERFVQKASHIQHE